MLGAARHLVFGLKESECVSHRATLFGTRTSKPSDAVISECAANYLDGLITIGKTGTEAKRAGYPLLFTSKMFDVDSLYPNDARGSESPIRSSNLENRLSERMGSNKGSVLAYTI